jgi:hypothetical protein
MRFTGYPAQERAVDRDERGVFFGNTRQLLVKLPCSRYKLRRFGSAGCIGSLVQHHRNAWISVMQKNSGRALKRKERKYLLWPSAEADAILLSTLESRDMLVMVAAVTRVASYALFSYTLYFTLARPALKWMFQARARAAHHCGSGRW